MLTHHMLVRYILWTFIVLWFPLCLCCFQRKKTTAFAIAAKTASSKAVFQMLLYVHLYCTRLPCGKCTSAVITYAESRRTRQALNLQGWCQWWPWRTWSSKLNTVAKNLGLACPSLRLIYWHIEKSVWQCMMNMLKGTSVTSKTSHIMWSLRKWGNWSWFHGWYQCFLDHWGSGEQGGAYSNLQLHIAGWSANSIKRPLKHCEYAIAQRSAVWGELCWKNTHKSCKFARPIAPNLQN